MKQELLTIEDACLLQNDIFNDVRGSFFESWEQDKILASNLSFTPSNACFSSNKLSGTLRGLHYQKAPYGQSKLVTCVAGAIIDIILDLRPDSGTYLKWTACSLKAFDGKAILIPAGCAHGFQTLEDNTVIAYLIDGEYKPDLSSTIRWNDPKFNINWPIPEPILSVKDSTASDFIL